MSRIPYRQRGRVCGFWSAKGATPEMIERPDTALTRYAHLIARDLHVDVLDLAGGGAAGGMGAALYAFCGAQLRRGIEIVTDALHLEACLADADLVITGEDASTARPFTVKSLLAWQTSPNGITSR